MRVAIVTPAYNVASCIGETIGSVLAQSYPDWAMVVVDDGSTDATAEIVAGFADPRIRLIRQVNGGVSMARNRGLDAAAGVDSILLLDGDDLLAPNALSRLVAALEADPGAVAACGPSAYVSEDGARRTHAASCPLAGGDFLGALLERNLFANGGHLLIRGWAATGLGGFRPGIAYGEDWEYWVRLALTGPFAVVAGRTPLLFVRQRPSGAYLRLAGDPDSFIDCMKAIFGNPELIQRLGAAAVLRARRRAEAENAWIIGRERIRHGKNREGRPWLRRSVMAKPSARRIGLLAYAHLLAVLPQGLRGPFRGYLMG